VRDLKVKACARFRLQPGSVLLMDAHHKDDPQPLEDQLDRSLLDADIVNGQALLLQPRKRHRDSQVQIVYDSNRNAGDASGITLVARRQQHKHGLQLPA
jgi:hypothetical protein